VELRELLGKRWPDRDPFALWHIVVCVLALEQVPPRGLWGRSGQVTLTTVEAWLGRSLDASPDPGAVVLCYLAAFGPASIADIRTWFGLPGVREILEPLRPRLRTFTDEGGRELLDVPGGALPDPDLPAAPCFLPEFDNALLSHASRSRIVPEQHRARVNRSLGKPMFLLDGFVGGTWKLIRSSAKRARIEISPFQELSPVESDALLLGGCFVLSILLLGVAVFLLTDAVNVETQPEATKLIVLAVVLALGSVAHDDRCPDLYVGRARSVGGG